MNNQNPNKYFITYSNFLEFEGRILAFRKQLLFDISGTPALVSFNEKANCWIVNRKQLTIKKAKELIIKKSKTVDVSSLQWYQQLELDECINL